MTLSPHSPKLRLRPNRISTFFKRQVEPLIPRYVSAWPCNLSKRPHDADPAAKPRVELRVKSLHELVMPDPHASLCLIPSSDGRKQVDTAPLAGFGRIEHLVRKLHAQLECHLAVGGVKESHPYGHAGWPHEPGSRGQFLVN